MSVRLVLAIVSTLLWAAILAAVVLFLLPGLGVDIPLPGLLALVAALAAYAAISYRIASRTLRQKPLVGLTSMIGSRGRVVSPLTPAGMIRIKGELWKAVASSGNIGTGEEVIVVGQDRLRLTVDRVKGGE